MGYDTSPPQEKFSMNKKLLKIFIRIISTYIYYKHIPYIYTMCHTLSYEVSVQKKREKKEQRIYTYNIQKIQLLK